MGIQVQVYLYSIQTVDHRIEKKKQDSSKLKKYS